MFRYFLIVTIICGFMKLYAQDSTKVLIVYYSQQGHTEKMAQAVERGARCHYSRQPGLQCQCCTTGSDFY